MDNLTNPYNRLQQFLFAVSFYFSKNKNKLDYRVPLQSIFEAVKVPIEVFRADLACFLEVSYEQYELFLNDESVLDKYCTDTGYDWDRFRGDMIAGQYDVAELGLYLYKNDKVLLPLTIEESIVMEEALKKHFYNNKEKKVPFLIKDSYHFNYQEEEKLRDFIYELHSAIKDKKVVTIDYLGEDSFMKIEPIRLLYDSSENLYAVICLDSDGLCAFRIDKIKKIEKTNEHFEHPVDLEERLSIIPNVWGLDFSAKPMDVKVRIFGHHSRGKVAISVKKDLERRTNGKLYVAEDCLIYEDTVYGKDAFLRWVFGYGRSMIVEKPESLRNEIVDILEKEVKYSGNH